MAGSGNKTDHDDAGGVASRWLVERHRKGWRNAYGARLAELAGDAIDFVDELDDGIAQMMDINISEWMIARGEIHAKGAPRPINAYL